MRKVFSFVLGAFTGGLFGAAAAILLTPLSGQDLRENIDNRIRNLQKEINDARNQKRAELEGQLQALRAPKA